MSKITSAVEEGYSGRLVIRAFNRERQSSAEVHEASKELARVSTKADFMINAVGPAVRFIGRLAQIVIALVGCSMLVAGHMTVGVFRAFFQFIYEASEPMTQLSFTFNSLQSALASAERVFDLLDEPEMEADPLPDKAAKLPGRVEGRVSFEHVRFGYSPDKLLMRDVSFTAEPGQKIAVVGTTGAGKTTLINLLMRFYEIDGGRITLDGVDTSRMDRGELRQQFGMVLQDAGCSMARLPKTSPTAAPRQRATKLWPRLVPRRSTSLCAPCRRATTRAWPTMPKASAVASVSC